jgi:hypothetical protein
MSAVDQAVQTQLKNLQARCGRTLAQLFDALRASGLAKHTELVALLKGDFALGHGDANLVAHQFRAAAGAAPAPAAAATDDAAVDAIYAARPALRPVHDALMKAIGAFGEFEVAPKKGYVSLRRKKQFAMIGPATKTQVEVGLNMKGVEAGDRLVALPAGGMCQYKVRIEAPAEVDRELVGWLRRAYDAAG